MAIAEFPPHNSADSDGLLAIGGDLDIESLLLAYRNGIFPWPFDEKLLAWFSPPRRALLFLDELHISRSLKKELKNNRYQFTMNSAFGEVIEGCSQLDNRKNQRGTWITPAMKKAYEALHKAGFAYSFECREDGELVAGIYGVSLQRAISAESMFYRKPNASKITLVRLVEFYREQGINWIDFQVLNPFTKSLGAREVSRAQFLKLLREGLGN